MNDQFNQSSSSERTGAATKIREAQDAVIEIARETKEKVAGYGQEAAGKIDAQRRPAANALDYAASALHERSDKGANLVHGAANKVQATAHYIREHDLKAMTDDLGALVRRYPNRSLVAAAIAGFFFARALRRNH